MIEYLRRLWPTKQLVTDGGSQDGLIFYSTGVKSYPTASVRNIKYGSSLQHGGRNYSYGFVDGRIAARIDHLLLISIKQLNNQPDLTTNIALVRRFKSAEHHIQNAATQPPWYTWFVHLLLDGTDGNLVVFARATDLGISHWYQDELGDLEAVPMDALSGRFCFGTIKFAKQKLWIAFSLDHVCHLLLLLKWLLILVSQDIPRT